MAKKFSQIGLQGCGSTLGGCVTILYGAVLLALFIGLASC